MGSERAQCPVTVEPGADPLHRSVRDARRASSPVRRLRGRLAAPVTLWTAPGPAGLTVSSTLVADGEPGRLLGLIDEECDLWAAVERGRAVRGHPARRRRPAARRPVRRADARAGRPVRRPATGPRPTYGPVPAARRHLGRLPAGRRRGRAAGRCWSRRRSSAVEIGAGRRRRWCTTAGRYRELRTGNGVTASLGAARRPFGAAADRRPTIDASVGAGRPSYGARKPASAPREGGEPA